MNASRRRAFQGLALLVAALAGFGCDYFRPADPEPPSAGAIIPDYSTPDASLNSMALGLADKARTNGASVYAGALAESTTTVTPGFHQFFWPEDRIRWESTSGRAAPGDWDGTLERNFYARFIALRGENYRLEWTPDDRNPDTSDSPNQANIHRRYRVLAESEDGLTSQVIAIGFADLVFYRSPQARWLIVRWNDRSDPDANAADPEQVTLGLRRLETQ